MRGGGGTEVKNLVVNKSPMVFHRNCLHFIFHVCCTAKSRIIKRVFLFKLH